MSETLILEGDCRVLLKTLPSESVHCVITSPPYLGLRDYGTATWDGGDESCEHVRPAQPRNTRAKGLFHSGSDTNNASRESVYPKVCGLCGAIRIDSQIGLEASPEAYIAELATVFREVRRVLRKDGTVWLNLGDSYNAADRVGHGTGIGVKQGTNRASASGADHVRSRDLGLKPKDLLGIPWRVAFALQEDGWYLRSDIIWSKPNPMPESVTDRPTKAHEYLFLLARSERYYYDADALREPATDYERKGGAAPYTANGSMTNGIGSTSLHQMSAAGRNKRSVWTIPTHPYPGAHFAVFPEKLIEPCLLAGTSERGCCPSCLAPWRRMVERSEQAPRVDASSLDRYGNGTAGVRRKVGGQYQKWLNGHPSATVGWEPTCRCNAGEPVPCTVLDPFAGSGTVLRVARKHHRSSIGIELNPSYCDLIRKRTSNVQQTLFREEPA